MLQILIIPHYFLVFFVLFGPLTCIVRDFFVFHFRKTFEEMMQFVLSISGNFLIVGKGRALQRRQMRGLLCNVSLIHNNISSLWSACMAPLGHVIHFKIISVVFLQRSSVNSDKHSSPFRSSCYAPLKDLQVITPDRPSYFIV